MVDVCIYMFLTEDMYFSGDQQREEMREEMRERELSPFAFLETLAASQILRE